MWLSVLRLLRTNQALYFAGHRGTMADMMGRPAERGCAYGAYRFLAGNTEHVERRALRPEKSWDMRTQVMLPRRVLVAAGVGRLQHRLGIITDREETE